MKLALFVILLSMISLGAHAKQQVNTVCLAAHLQSFIVDTHYSGTTANDLCTVQNDKLPTKAQNALKLLFDLNQKIAKVLELPKDEPFLDGLRVELKISPAGPLDDSFDNKNSSVIIGAEKNNYFYISPTIYTHEIGHWYLSKYFFHKMSIDLVASLPTFQEFFADALALSVLGDLDFSVPGLPQCLTHIRDVGPNITYKNKINFFDYGSFFRRNNECCSMLEKSGKQTDLTQAACNYVKDVQSFYFPNGVPSGSSAPLDQNITTAVTEKDERLEPHLSSTPMTSFVMELSRKIKIPIMKLILPALYKSVSFETEYVCQLKEIINQGMFDFSDDVTQVSIDDFFKQMSASLSADQKKIFSETFEQYAMRGSQEIIRKDIYNILAFTEQNKIKENIHNAWLKGNPFLKSWQCIDQATGRFSDASCNLNIECQPKDNDKRDKHIFMRKDEKNILYTPVVRFVNEKLHNEVLFVGLNHIGPNHYFKDAYRRIVHLASNPNKKTIVLREFFTCQDYTETLNSHVDEITKDQVDVLNKISDVYYPFSFLSPSHLNDLKPLFDIYKLSPESCQVDMSGRTFRPLVLLERNKTVCEKTAKEGIACQWNSLEKDLDDNSFLSVKSGDLVLNQEPAGVQIAAINMYKGLSTANDLNLWSRLFIPTNYVINNLREENLLKQILMASENGYNQVIVPWGVGHVADLKLDLYLHGYKQFSISDVPYASMEDHGKDVSIDNMLDLESDVIGSSYFF